MTRKRHRNPESNQTDRNTDSENEKLPPSKRARESHSQKQDKTESKEDDEVCPECNGDLTPNEKRGEKACVDCGLVVEADEIDRGPEWRAFDNQEFQEKSRVGSPVSHSQHDKGLTTKIDWKNTDGYGQQLSNRKKRQVARLRKQQRWSKARNSKERSRRAGFTEIERMTAALGLPDDTRDFATRFYRQAHEEGLLVRHSIEALASACTYIASRLTDVPRTLDEVEQVSRVPKKKFTSLYQDINRELGLKIEPTDPNQLIDRFTSNINEHINANQAESDDYPDDYTPVGQRPIDTEITKLTKDIINEIGETKMSGKNPAGFAAGAIYYAAYLGNRDITQQTVSEATEITKVTIRKRVQEIVEMDEEEFYDTFTESE